MEQYEKFNKLTDAYHPPLWYCQDRSTPLYDAR